MAGDLGQLTMADLMNTEVVTVDKNATLQEAIGIMVKNGIRHLPVMQGKKVVALISDRNVRMMVSDMIDPQERRRYLETTPVSQNASSPVTTGRPETSAAEAAQIFVESRIGCLPIVDQDDHLVGIVTQTDLLKWLASMTGQH